MSNCFLILHDQLNAAMLPEDVRLQKTPLLFLESGAKGRSLPYHKQKLVYVLAAQRHFAHEMEETGHEVTLWSGAGHYDALLTRFLEKNPDVQITCFEAAERDTRARIQDVQRTFPERITVLDNPFFLSKPEEWKERIRKGYRLEYFYREMRRRTGFLMEGDAPAGGTWNFDKENRKALPASAAVPLEPGVAPDAITHETIELVNRNFADHPGSTEGFALAVTRRDALHALETFISQRLPQFGAYEDAMKTGEALLFHSGLSTYLNNGLLLPKEVCTAAEGAWKSGAAPLASVEGFIRQITGWREYVRCYYEAMMPEVRSANALNLQNGIPQAFWDGKTDMKCLQECAGQAIGRGYTHHIPRLMVLSNLATLTETDPAEVLLWFWSFYTDAYEWVVLPNVLGMSTFADGGVLASKPYIAGGNYINTMSNYCKSCRYDVKKRTGEDACPFNALYWRFVARNEQVFKDNGRVSFALQTWNRMHEDEQRRILTQADAFSASLPRYPHNAVTLFSTLHDPEVYHG
jgi:deoxyribodipyrimidine photolyase-related protein